MPPGRESQLACETGENYVEAESDARRSISRAAAQSGSKHCGKALLGGEEDTLENELSDQE